MSVRGRLLLAALAVAVGAGGITFLLLPERGSAPRPAATPDAVSPPTPAAPEPPAAPAATCTPGKVRVLTGGRRAYAAWALRGLTAFRTPGGPAVAHFGRRNVNGVPTVLGVLAARVDRRCAPRWYRVQLPIRPNGAAGWVRADAVRVSRVETRILVDLSDRRVTLYRNGRAVLRSLAAIGHSGTPTPTGRYYVNQRLRAPDPSGPFGPGAVGISAFSPTLQHWAQGGPIAIHGTNTPYKLGLAVSYGCVRIRNSDLLRLFDLADEGTPVVIRT